MTDELTALKARLAQYERPFDEAEVQEALEWFDRHYLEYPSGSEIDSHELAHRKSGKVLLAALRRERAEKEAAERELALMKAVVEAAMKQYDQGNFIGANTCFTELSDACSDYALKKAQEGV